MPRNELFIGNLGRDVSQRDIKSVFDKYGKILRCDVKNKGFFYEF
jgi:RNA recognition motif-containing protein